MKGKHNLIKVVLMAVDKHGIKYKDGILKKKMLNENWMNIN